MIHAICDFCGNDCGRTAQLITITPFQNFARYDTDSAPYGSEGPKRSFVICSDCSQKKGLPNPFHHYHKLSSQEVGYAKTLDNYTESDIKEDIRAEKKGAMLPETSPQPGTNTEGGPDDYDD